MPPRPLCAVLAAGALAATALLGACTPEAPTRRRDVPRRPPRRPSATHPARPGDDPHRGGGAVHHDAAAHRQGPGPPGRRLPRRRDERVLRPEGGSCRVPTPTDRARCPGELPSRPHCDGLVPWTGLLPDAFVPASRARRLVGGYLLTMPKQAGNQAPPESSAGTKVVTFNLVDLAAGDPGGLVDYLDVAFRACAKATPSTVAGVGALVGTVRSEYGAGSAEVVLLRRGTHLVWAALDGSGWSRGSSSGPSPCSSRASSERALTDGWAPVCTRRHTWQDFRRTLKAAHETAGVAMPIATPEVYAEMLDRAKAGSFAYPAINVSCSQTLNAALKGFADAGSDGIIQVSTGGADYLSGPSVKNMVSGSLAFAAYAHEVAKNYPVNIALHTDHCPKDKLDGFVRPLLAASTERVQAGGTPWFQSHMWDGSAVPLDENLADRAGAARPRQGRQRHPRDRGRRRRRRGGRRRGRHRREALLDPRGRHRHDQGPRRRRERPLPDGPHLRQRPRRLQAGQRQAAPRDPPAGPAGRRQGARPVRRRAPLRPRLPRRLRLAARGDLAPPSTTASSR